MSFPVRNVIKKEIYGSYRLQSQACLVNPSAPISDIMCEISQSSVDEIVSMEDVSSSAIASAPSGTSTTGTVTIGTTACCADSSIEQISLSKKAIHQRDADENLFLRFLELDPSPDGIPSSGSLPISTTPRRTSVCSGKPASSAGRTPFTITKRLVRSGDRGYGFSIVWTHPPRVEKIESGLSAEKAGILPGDYVVFVEKHNVVTMPEQDVLNLIRTQGNTLLLEIFRRPLQTTAQQQQKQRLGNVLRNSTADMTCTTTTTSSSGNLLSFTPYHMPNNTLLVLDESELSLKTTPCGAERSSTACSNISIETAKRKLHLPQVTFSKESIVHQFTDHRRKLLYQLINREQHFINAINFGIERFVNPLRERKDLISSNDHKTLFQNIDELSRISEDILEQVIQDETELRIHFASRVYLSKSTALCVAYRKYCNGLKKADCVLVNKSRNSNCDFMKFITEPPVPRKRPDLTTFIHRPLQHFREILKHMQMIASHCRVDSEEQINFNSIINELQTSYREITVGGGLMEPIGEGRPLLTLQDLEARMVFTKCKPFQLVTRGRQWIFGGDLSRIEGRSVKPYWTLLFSDILLFAKVSRDRVLFITEEPISLSTVTDSCFNIRKKGTEFRLTIDPSGRQIESPTVHCAPDLTRTPKKNLKKRYVVLRAPSTELKAVWQNLLTRQIFLVNATLGCTPLSSPLDSPDILQSLVPIADIGATVTTIAPGNISSLDNVHQKNNQVCFLGSLAPSHRNNSITSSINIHNSITISAVGLGLSKKNSTVPAESNIKDNRTNKSLTTMPDAISELPEILMLQHNKNSPVSSPKTVTYINATNKANMFMFDTDEHNHNYLPPTFDEEGKRKFTEKSLKYASPYVPCCNGKTQHGQIVSSSSKDRHSFLRGTRENMRSIVEFSLSSVGRSFIDNAEESDIDGQSLSANDCISTPETPPANVSPSSSNKISDAFSNDFKEQQQISPSVSISIDAICNEECNKYLLASGYGGSWDLLELDLDFHQVNCDPSFVNDVIESEFLGDDDPFGMLPTHPTPPNLLDL